MSLSAAKIDEARRARDAYEGAMAHVRAYRRGYVSWELADYLKRQRAADEAWAVWAKLKAELERQGAVL